jgi:flagellar basal body-associated protein FliL
MADAPEQPDVQQEEKPKSKLPFIIGGLVIILVGVVAVSMTLLRGQEEGPQLKSEYQEPGYMYEFTEPFVVNLAPPDNQLLCNAEITLEIVPADTNATEAEALKELGIENPDYKKHKMPIVREAIKEILSSQTQPQVNSSKGREIIKESIQIQLNKILGKAKIKNVYMEILVP